ncbi:hypothetical protein [Dyella sp. GSA-30]|uniref:hypothetical protein n=1 Tax=Dyella sp. GSA-30 TaxID=2994496 RepID=UPI002492A617|nr:hypothetical protein [Dyella sp. GSA-30]
MNRLTLCIVTAGVALALGGCQKHDSDQVQPGAGQSSTAATPPAAAPTSSTTAMTPAAPASTPAPAAAPAAASTAAGAAPASSGTAGH